VFGHVFSDQNADEGFGGRGKSSFFWKKPQKAVKSLTCERFALFSKFCKRCYLKNLVLKNCQSRPFLTQIENKVKKNYGMEKVLYVCRVSSNQIFFTKICSSYEVQTL